MSRRIKQSDSPAATSALRLSLIVPAHRADAALHRALDAIRGCEPAADEVLVVVDGDARAVGDAARARGFSVLETKGQQGPAVARNVGARHSRGALLMFVDADVLLQPDAIKRVRDTFDADPELGALFGSYDDKPAEPNLVSQYKNLLHHYVHQHGREEASTFWAGCGAISKRLFHELGGFDESYRRPMIEDIELGYRLVRQGARIRLFKQLQVKHLKRWTLRSLLQSDFRDRALPWARLILRTGNFPRDLNLDVRNRVSVVLCGALIVILPLSALSPPLLPAALALAGALLVLHQPLYSFFAQKRGLAFAAAALPLHWFSFFYSGLAFAIAAFEQLSPAPTRMGKSEA